MHSVTGRQNGFGRDPWKWVSGLTPQERAAVRRGELVTIDSEPCPQSPDGIRIVIYRRDHGGMGQGRYLPRVPSWLDEDKRNAWAQTYIEATLATTRADTGGTYAIAGR